MSIVDAGALEWSVGTVADRLGIATSTLRTWDRRYGVGPSRRTAGGHRRYGEDDILRVRVMARHTARGVPAQTAARVALSMDRDQLREQVADPARVASPDAPAPSADVSVGPVPDRARAITAAAAELDGVALVEFYRRTLGEHDLVTAWTMVLAPAMRLIGQQWGRGLLGVESEHLASELLISELRALVRLHRGRHARPATVILASAEEDQHYLPLLAVDAELARRGVDSHFLGSRVPADSLAEAIAQSRPEHVFLWASLARPDGDPVWERLRSGNRSLHVVTGGPGWPGRVPVDSSDRLRVEHADDLSTAVTKLMTDQR